MPIDGDARGERVGGLDEPLGEPQAISAIEFSETTEEGGDIGDDDLGRLQEFTSMVEMGWPREFGGALGHHQSGRMRRPLLLDRADLLAKNGSLLGQRKKDIANAIVHIWRSSDLGGGEGIFNIGRQNHLTIVAHVGGVRETEASHAARVVALEDEGEIESGFDIDWLIELKDRDVGSSLEAIDRPAGLWVAVDRLHGCVAGIGDIGDGAPNLDGSAVNVDLELA